MSDRVPLLRRVREGLLAGLFPADCLLCAGILPWRQRGGVCLPCWEAIPWTPGTRLSRRGPLRAVLWGGDYSGDIRRLIQVFKFEGMEALGPALALSALDRSRALLLGGSLRPDLVLAVPLHWTRQWRRGYNQSEILAEALASAVGLPVVPGLLRRPRAAGRQIGLGRTDRLEALNGVFRARPSRMAGPPGSRRLLSLRGRVVLLVDDVTTTGATLEACAVALRGAGASAVVGFVVARTP